MPARATETAAALLAAASLLVESAPVLGDITSLPPPRWERRRPARSLTGNAAAFTNTAGETPTLPGEGTVGGPFSQEQPLHPALHPLAAQEGEHRRLQDFPISGAEGRQTDKDVALFVEP